MSNPIGWCTHTINPIVGCNNDCEWCYARAFARRNLTGCPQCKEFKPHLHPERLDQLLAGKRAKTPWRIFIGSVTDFWSDGVEPEWREAVWERVREATWNTFIVLTQCPGRIDPQEIVPWPEEWPENLWLGVTVRRPEEWPRMVDLRRAGVPQERTVMSCEPILDDLGPVTSPGWCIVGPLTKPGGHVADTPREWLTNIAEHSQVPIWMKDSCAKAWLDLELRQELPADMTERSN